MPNSNVIEIDFSRQAQTDPATTGHSAEGLYAHIKKPEPLVNFYAELIAEAGRAVVRRCSLDELTKLSWHKDDVSSALTPEQREEAAVKAFEAVKSKKF